MNKLQSFIDEFGGAELAKRLRVSKGTVSHWRHGRFQVSASRCREIEDISGGAVTVHDLRPDIFGPAQHPAEAA
jgi:DNA-binding transcriptional regulator YdaS (Cro superfamily)